MVSTAMFETADAVMEALGFKEADTEATLEAILAQR